MLWKLAIVLAGVSAVTLPVAAETNGVQKEQWLLTGAYTPEQSGDCSETKFEVSEHQSITTQGDTEVQAPFTEYGWFLLENNDGSGRYAEYGVMGDESGWLAQLFVLLPDAHEHGGDWVEPAIQLELYSGDAPFTEGGLKDLLFDGTLVTHGLLFPCAGK